ncbi:MAG: serine kinase [Syntrophaceae bacterium]|nr:serine kinase [Syntrophaceae bacterium]
MDLSVIATTLNLKIFCGHDKLNTVVNDGYTGDLLSDVMANGKEGDLWITRQIHQNIIAVASLKDLAGIILVQGAEPAEDTLEKAIKEDIPIMGTNLNGFEVAGKIYNMIKGKEDSART